MRAAAARLGGTPFVALFAAICCLALASPCLARPWADVRTAGPFVCHADFILPMDSLLPELVQLQNDLVERLRIKPAAEPIELYLFRERRTYRAYVGRHFPDVSYRRALYIKRSTRGMVFACWDDGVGTDLRHECTHALLHAALPVVPLWLDEGLAVYFEVPVDKREAGNPHLSSIRWAVRIGTAKRLGDLERISNIDGMGWSEYANCWAWVHFLLHGPPEARDELVRFLADLEGSVPPGKLSQRLEARLDHTCEKFNHYFLDWK